MSYLKKTLKMKFWKLILFFLILFQFYVFWYEMTHATFIVNIHWSKNSQNINLSKAKMLF
jgi:hypothetical protein